MQTLRSNSLLASSPQTRPAILQVARLRTALNWLLSLPQWEDLLAIAATELSFPGQRQGIARVAAFRSLPTERKFALVRHALASGLPAPSHAEAVRLANLLGISSYRGRKDFQRPSASQWSGLAKRVQIRLTHLYSKYKDAQTELYAAYQSIPEQVARGICRRPSLREDAQQEARLALLDAIDHAEDVGCFEAYARQWIKRRIQNFLMRSKLPVKAPINLISKSLRQTSGANPELTRALKEGIVSLDDESAYEAGHNPALATEPERGPAAAAESADLRAAVGKALSELTAKQRQVVELRFGLSRSKSTLSLSQISLRTGISRQQVHQREKRALQKLAKSLANAAAEQRLARPAASDR